MSPEQACKFTDARLQDQDFVETLDEVTRSSAGAIEGAKFNWDGSVIVDWFKKEKMVFGLSRMIEYHIIKLCPKYSPLLTTNEMVVRMANAKVQFQPIAEPKDKSQLYLHGEAGQPGCSTYGLHVYVDEKLPKIKGQKPGAKKRVKTNKLANASKYTDGFNPDIVIDAALEHAIASSEFWAFRAEFLDGIETKGDPRLFERVKLFFLRTMIVAITKDQDIEITNSGMHQRVENVSLAERLADPLLRYRPSKVADQTCFNAQSWGHLKI